MAMPLQDAAWTADMARALPDDGQRYEVLDGELFVTPAPSLDHQRMILALVRHLDPYLLASRIGEVFFAPADVEFSARRLLQPDVFVIPPTTGVRPRNFREAGRLLLAIEVLSPSTARADRTRKREIFQDERVPEYWIVDGSARIIERWLPDDNRPEVQAQVLRWQPRADVAPLDLDLPRLFADALDPLQ